MAASSGGPRRTYSLPPAPTRRLVRAAALLAVLAPMVVLGTATRKPEILAPGPLTSGHAAFQADCKRCHAPGPTAAVTLCVSCHDPARQHLEHREHVAFGSGDRAKAAAATALACARCHVEHRGSRAALASVPSATCYDCHFPSFAAHPEFEMVRTRGREAAGLKFGHERHIKELVELTGDPPSETCVSCHQADPRGRDFVPLSFPRHCASCHEKEGMVGRIPKDVGRPVVHRDPEVLAALGRLQRSVDPDGWSRRRGGIERDLADLRERLAAVQKAAEATMVPAVVREERQRLQTAVEEAGARLAALDEMPEPGPDGPAPAARVQAAAAPCLACHVAEGAWLLPVRAARPVLTRARFVHQPHLLQADCADCHAGIEKSTQSAELSFRGVESCRSCHRPQRAAHDCTGCHRYHPPRDRR